MLALSPDVFSQEDSQLWQRTLEITAAQRKCFVPCSSVFKYKNSLQSMRLRCSTQQIHIFTYFEAVEVNRR